MNCVFASEISIKRPTQLRTWIRYFFSGEVFFFLVFVFLFFWGGVGERNYCGTKKELAFEALVDVESTLLLAERAGT